MGGVAGASGPARRMTAPWIAVVPEAVVADFPPLSRDQLADAAASGRPGVLRRQLIVALAHRALGLPIFEVRLVADARGRRMLGGQAVFASVAWRPGWVAAALAPGPVGIDIELIEDAAAARDVALDGFDGDAARLAAWNGAAGVWAAKEAVLKTHGRDLTTAPARWRFGDGVVAARGLSPTRVKFARAGAACVALAAGDRGYRTTISDPKWASKLSEYFTLYGQPFSRAQ